MKIFKLLLVIGFCLSMAVISLMSRAQTLPQPTNTSPTVVIPQPSNNTKTLTNFNTIEVDGAIALTLVAADAGSNNYVSIAPNDQPQVTTAIKNGTLMLSASTKSPLNVIVGVNQLSRLKVHGPSSVVANNLKTTNFALLSDGSGTINLNGLLGVSEITAIGNNQISLVWVNSSQLNCFLDGNVQLKLAGKTQALEARLAGKSSLDAKYLRAQQVTVQTRGTALAQVHPDESLKAFAYDHSNIYYDKRPTYFTEMTRGSGNVLQSAWNK